MARKVAAIEHRLDRIAQSLFDLMPQLYKDRTQLFHSAANTPMNAAWNEAIAGMGIAHRAVGELSGLLSEKAESKPMPNPCPFVEAARK